MDFVEVIATLEQKRTEKMEEVTTLNAEADALLKAGDLIGSFKKWEKNHKIEFNCNLVADAIEILRRAGKEVE